jgi:hypothetical protein
MVLMMKNSSVVKKKRFFRNKKTPDWRKKLFVWSRKKKMKSVLA